MKKKNLIGYILILLFLVGCSSAKEKPTKDTCELKKHYKDNVFQILINDKPINSHWYIYPDAVDIAGRLADRNKCMR